VNGTAAANSVVLLYDGTTWLGPASANSTGACGNIGNSSNEAILGSTNADNLVGTSGNDIIIGNGGNDKFTGGGGANVLIGGSGSDTFIFKAIADSTPANHDTIVNFNHVSDIIEFTGFAGINASHGIATFQGQLAGSGNLILNAHSVGYIEVGGNTEVLVNTANSAETVSAVHAANMEIVLAGIHLGLTSNDFHIV
jgi:Ca2+-binding RTX toxin-like protein